MAYTAVTITGTATMPSGLPIAGALVNFEPDEGVLNGGTPLGGAQAVAAGNGTFSIIVNATDDAGTTPTNAKYNVAIIDPSSDERVFRQSLAVPHLTTPTTLAALIAADAASSI